MQKFLLIIFSLFLTKTAWANPQQQAGPNTKYISPQPIPNYLLKREQEKQTIKKFRDTDQYKGDHSRAWYEKQKDKTDYYLGININYAIISNLDAELMNTEDVPGQTTTYNGSIDVGGAVGFGFTAGILKNKIWAYELELAHHIFEPTNFTSSSVSVTGGGTPPDNFSNDFTEGYNITATSGFINMLFNLGGRRTIAPFIGGGIGYSRVASENDSGFFLTYQGKLGISYNLSKNMNFEFGLKHIDYGEVEYNATRQSGAEDTFKHDLAIQSIYLGYRFDF